MTELKLTKNQKVFADEYLKDRNGTRAYKVAYPNITKDKSAEQGASRLLSRNVKVKAYIDKRLAELSENAGITAERVLQEEGHIAFSDLRQIFDGESLISPSELPEEVARALAGVEVTERPLYQDGELIGAQRTFKYKFWDKGRALERLEKHLGMFQADKLNEDDVDRVAERIIQARKRIAEIAEIESG